MNSTKAHGSNLGINCTNFLRVFYLNYIDPDIFTPTNWPICVKLSSRGANYNNFGPSLIENSLENSQLFMWSTYEMSIFALPSNESQLFRLIDLIKIDLSKVD